ncbi:MAG: TIGR02206 family membrane protein [Chthoniobacterales bacterium]
MDSSTPTFEFLGPAHLTAIMATAVVPFALSPLGRRSARVDGAIRITLAVILTLNFIGYGVRASLSGAVQWQQTLPFQLCDWTMILVIAALLYIGRPSSASPDGPDRTVRGHRLVEVAYFWGIGGSLQAVITPNLSFGYPDYRFFTFFIDHCGIVIAICYLMLTRRVRPYPMSIWRTWMWSMVYLAITLVIDQLTGVNYGFLLHKPEAFSILSYLSDSRAVYILQLNLLALMFFAVLYAPFAIHDCIRSRRGRLI